MRQAIILALLLAACGCGGGEGDSDGVAPKAAMLPESGMLKAYGRPNDWLWMDEGQMREEIRTLAENGWDAYLIELGGAAGVGEITEAEAREAVSQRYPQLVDECEWNEMLLIVSIQNDCAGEGKYGSKSVSLEDQQEFSAWLVDLVAAVGKPGTVMVQPVAETKTRAGLALETLCAEKLSGFTLVWNGEGGHPNPDDKPAWATYCADHPDGISGVESGCEIVVGDHGKTIRELDVDGDMDGWSDPDDVSRFLNAGRKAGAKMTGVYIFSNVGAIDTNTISQARKAK